MDSLRFLCHFSKELTWPIEEHGYLNDVICDLTCVCAWSGTKYAKQRPINHKCFKLLKKQDSNAQMFSRYKKDMQKIKNPVHTLV